MQVSKPPMRPARELVLMILACSDSFRYGSAFWDMKNAPFRIDVKKRDLCAFRVQPFCDRKSNALGSARHDCFSAFQLHMDLSFAMMPQ